MDRKNQIGLFIKERREELSMSRDKLGQRVSYGYPNMITMIENGKVAFPIESWERFAEALEVSKPDFLKRVLEEKHPNMLPYIQFKK